MEKNIESGIDYNSGWGAGGLWDYGSGFSLGSRVQDSGWFGFRTVGMRAQGILDISGVEGDVLNKALNCQDVDPSMLCLPNLPVMQHEPRNHEGCPYKEFLACAESRDGTMSLSHTPKP